MNAPFNGSVQLGMLLGQRGGDDSLKGVLVPFGAACQRRVTRSAANRSCETSRAIRPAHRQFREVSIRLPPVETIEIVVRIRRRV
jgi:hypothetical protein